MIRRRTFTAMLAGTPLLFWLPRKSRTEDVCGNCGDFPKVSRDDPNAFSVHFGDNTTGVARRYVVEGVRLNGEGLPLTSVREMIVGRSGLVVYAPHGKFKVCETCENGVVWRVSYGHVEVDHYKGPRFDQSLASL